MKEETVVLRGQGSVCWHLRYKIDSLMLNSDCERAVFEGYLLLPELLNRRLPSHAFIIDDKSE